MNPYSTEKRGAVPWQCAPLANVVIRDDAAVCQTTPLAYDPFELYYGWVERRDAPAPPHLALVNLHQDPLAAKAFLETYGHLTGPTSRSRCVEFISQEQAEVIAGATWSEAVVESDQILGTANDYWENHHPTPVRLPPGLPGGATQQHVERWLKLDLREFWAEQGEILLLYRLWETRRNGRDLSETLACLRGTLRDSPSRNLLNKLLEIFDLRRPDPRANWDQVAKQELTEHLSLKTVKGDRIQRAVSQLLTESVNTQLRHTRPMLWDENEGLDSTPPNAIWECQELLEAFYMMFFLDIQYGRRLLRCDNCGILFAETKENVRFCSTKCERQHRVRKWWQLHGKEYRASQRKAGAVRKPQKKRTGRKES